ncbi:hypothetical protein GQ600_26733 [Phytophthora cactorum]|nr:hypothetical protein GQ600_26733 [Phytophthora cactorum]
MPRRASKPHLPRLTSAEPTTASCSVAYDTWLLAPCSIFSPASVPAGTPSPSLATCTRVSRHNKNDLIWWSRILDSPHLNGVPLKKIHACPVSSIVVDMDASDTALCALVPSARLVLRYRFSDGERQLIQATKTAPAIGFDINYRELLSCAFAVHTWGQPGAEQGSATEVVPVHVQFRIDNTSVVAWQSKLASCNPRAPDHHSSSRSLGSVPGADNQIADTGSRFYSNSTMACIIEELTCGWLQIKPTVDIFGLEAIRRSIPSSLCRSTHERHVPRRATSMVQLVVTERYPPCDDRYRYGSSRPIRGVTIAATLHGILHFFQAAALNFPSSHPQIRMVFKGSYRLDGPVCHKTPSRLSYSNAATGPSICRLLPTKLYEGALCMEFFFLLRRSEIASKGKTHFHGSLSRQLT